MGPERFTPEFKLEALRLFDAGLVACKDMFLDRPPVETGSPRDFFVGSRLSVEHVAIACHEL